MRRRFLSISIILSMLLSLCFGTVAYAEELQFQQYSAIYYGNSNIKGRCVYQNNSTYIPLRLVSQMTGHAVTWNDKTHEIGITKKNVTVRCTPYQDKYTVNNKNVTLGKTPILSEGTTYVPVDFIGDVLGLSWYSSGLMDITILNKDTLTIQVTDTSEYHDEDDIHKGEWIEGTCSGTNLDTFYVTDDTDFNSSVRFRNVKKGDILEATVVGGSGLANGEVYLKEVTVKSADANGYMEFAGEITQKNYSSIKVKLNGSSKYLTLNTDSKTVVRAQGSSRVLKVSDLETGLDVYGVYDYKNSTSGTAISIVVGDYYDSIQDAEKGDIVSFSTSEITSKGNDYIYADIEGKSVRLDIDSSTTIKDVRNSNSGTTITLSKLTTGSKIYGTYKYQTSSRGTAVKLYMTNQSTSNNYTSGSKVYFDNCKVTKVSSSSITVKIDGISVVLSLNSSTDIHPEGRSTSLRYSNIRTGDYINGSYRYNTAFKGTAYEIEIRNYSGSNSSRYDYDYDYSDGDIITFDGYIQSADSSNDYITVRIDGKNVKLEIDRDTVVKRGTSTITNPDVSDFERYEGYDVSGRYEYISSNRGYCKKITIESSSSSRYDDYDYDDEVTIRGEVTKVGSSYIKVDDDGDIIKIYIDDDTRIRRGSSSSSRYDIDDISEGDTVRVTYYEYSSSKNIASEIRINY